VRWWWWPGRVLSMEGWAVMASSGKKKTTFAKLAREQKLRERRVEKRARKDARKRDGVDLGPVDPVVGEAGAVAVPPVGGSGS
jgi:hypothetical protein